MCTTTQSRAPLVHLSCTSRASPITVVGLPAPWPSATHTHAHLVHYSISCTSYSCASSAPLVHQSFSCTSNHCRGTSRSLTVGTRTREPLVHLSCTSNHCRGTSRSLAVGTSYSCTSRALLNLVHYSISCTSYSCTSRALHTRASLVHLNLVHQSYSCTNRTRAAIMLVHPSSSPLVAPFKRN